MVPNTIALIAADDSEATRPGWWDATFRHWPVYAAQPRLELVIAEDLLSDAKGLVSVKRWDAAVLAPAKNPADTSLYRALDVIQQQNVPALMLVRGELGRMNGFHPGHVIVQPIDGPPEAIAAAVHALAQRQTMVRGLEQNLKMAHSFQGETAAEIDRLHQELLLAARVQRDFLPKHMPVVDGVESAVLFRPAGFVSGDTYDVCRLDEYHVGFFLADAMGHGVPAALMTLYISGSLPRKEIDAGGYRLVPPAESLKRLNAELHASVAGPARFATAVCGLIDTRSGLVTLACAGHPPPLRVSRYGVKPVDVSGMLLGVVDDFDYQQVTIRLEEDELLLVHSDGIETAFAPRRLIDPASSGKVNPQTYMSQLAGMRRGASLDNLHTAMERFAETLDAQAGSFHQDDDLTVLAFQTTCKREPMRGMRTADSRVVGGESPAGLYAG